MDFHREKQREKTTPYLLGLGLIFGLYLLWSYGLGTQPTTSAIIIQAVAVVRGDSTVTGSIHFSHNTKSGIVSIEGNLAGLDHNALRGFHIHQSGNLTNGCLSAGPHFNPYGLTHGARESKTRHVGDLGNIKSDSAGKSRFSIEDSTISLVGPLSIVGRAVVIHAGVDDLGKGGDEESLKTGNAGGRAACGVIGLA